MDNEIAVQNLTKMAKQKGCQSAAEKLGEREYRVLLTVGEPVEAEAEAPVCTPDARTDTVVAIASDKMGEGAEELGKTLLKAFVFFADPAGQAAQDHPLLQRRRSPHLCRLAHAG